MPRPLLSPNQITWSRLLIQIHILNDKQCRSRSVGFFRSQLIWIYTVCKGRVYLGSARLGLRSPYIQAYSFILSVRQERGGDRELVGGGSYTSRGINTLSGEATVSKLFLPPFWKGVYSKRKYLDPFQKGVDVQKSKPGYRSCLPLRK